MQIKHAVERPDGRITIQADFGPAEVAFLLEYALNSLYERGALPFLTEDTAAEKIILDPPEGIQ